LGGKLGSVGNSEKVQPKHDPKRIDEDDKEQAERSAWFLNSLLLWCYLGLLLVFIWFLATCNSFFS
jgi:hypothetical protein